MYKNWDSYHLENDPPKLKQLFEQGSIFIGAFDASEKLVVCERSLKSSHNRLSSR